MNELESIAHQAESAAKTQIARGIAAVRRETSIVNAAAGALGQAQTAAEARIKRSGVYTKNGPDSHQYIEADTAYATARSVPVFDIKSPGKLREGLRRSPVQAMRTAPGYYRRRAWRIAGMVILGAAVVAAAFTLLHYWGY